MENGLPVIGRRSVPRSRIKSRWRREIAMLYPTSTLGKLHLGDAALGQCQLRAEPKEGN